MILHFAKGGRMKKKMVIGIAILIIATMVPVFAAGESETAASKPVTFMWWGNETRHAATNAAVDQYMAANPDKKVTTMPNPFDGYHDKIIIQLANGTAPDLFCFSTEWMAEVAYTKDPVLKNLYDLSDYIDLSEFSENLYKGGEINGRLLGLPTGISGWTYTYNINKLQEYVQKTGNPLPPGPGESWTFEEFIQYGKDFHDAMGPSSALIATTKDSLSHFLVHVLSEIAGAYYVNDQAQMQFTRSDLVETLNLFERMTDVGLLPAGRQQVESLSGTTVTTTNVAAGNWAGWYCWTSNVAENEDTSNSPVGIMAYPSLGRPEADGLFVRPAQFWAISRDSKNAEDAARLLNFIVNDPKSIAELELQRSVPPTEAGQKVLADMGVLSGPAYESTRYLMQSADSKYTPFILVAELTEALRNEYSKFIVGSQTVDKTADSLMSQFDSILSRIRKTNGIE